MAIYIEGKAFVPEIKDDKLNELIEKIAPVIRRDNKLYNIQIPDLRNTAYTWEPKIKDECIELKEVLRIKTDHYCGYYGLFKPSIAEVMAQIPDNMIDKICAFEIISDMNSGEDEEIKIYNYGNGQQATTVLYSSK